MQKYIVLVGMFWLLTGCAIDFNATERTQIRANADVAVAQAERDAAIGAAQAEASKSQAWAMVAVPLAIVIMGGVAVVVVVWWQGKIYHARATTPIAQLLPGQPEFYPALRQVARRQNARITIVGNSYYLVDSDGWRQEVKALLPG